MKHEARAKTESDLGYECDADGGYVLLRVIYSLRVQEVDIEVVEREGWGRGQG